MKNFIRLLVTCLYLCLGISAYSWDGLTHYSKPLIDQALEESAAIEAMPIGFNIKASPMIYWHTVLVSVEYPIPSIPLNVGINAYGSWGFENDKDISVQERWEEPGFGIDLYAKFFLLSGIERPEGLYVQGNISYNTIVYQEGVIRPFALNDNSSTNQDVTSQPIKIDPDPFNFGFGVGYQLILIPRHIVADIMLGTQLSKNDGDVLPTIYLLPSIGYTF